jgi:hypothetical protein
MVSKFLLLPTELRMGLWHDALQTNHPQPHPRPLFTWEVLSTAACASARSLPFSSKEASIMFQKSKRVTVFLKS